LAVANVWLGTVDDTAQLSNPASMLNPAASLDPVATLNRSKKPTTTTTMFCGGDTPHGQPQTGHG
jgi:hypothetical protein